MTINLAQPRRLRIDYRLSEDRKNILEIQTADDQQKRKKKSDDTIAEVLCRFARIINADQLLEFAKEYGLPDRVYKQQKVLQDMAQAIAGRAKQNADTALIDAPYIVDSPVIFPHPVQYFLDWSAILNWLIYLVDAICEEKHELLKLWIIDTYVPPKVPSPPRAADIPKDAIRLSMAPPADMDEYKGFYVFRDKIGFDFPRHFFPSEWEEKPENLRFDFAKAYASGCISQLMRPIHPVITDRGEASFLVKEPLNKMVECLFNQLTGASFVGICANPRCPDRFFAKDGKVKGQNKRQRAPHGNRQFCHRSSCQTAVYEMNRKKRAFDS